MFSYLKGTITEKNIDKTTFVIETNDVAYLIHTNLNFLSQIIIDNIYKIYLSCQIKEDGHKLFGFRDRATRDIFEILLSVSGVGPKAALSILNIFEIDEIIAAVLQDNSKLIAEAQGIGPKTAKRIILELQNKLSKFNPGSSHKHHSKSYDSYAEVSNLLNNLGYTQIEIDRIFKKAKESEIEDDTETIIKFSLKNLSEKALN